MLNNQTGFTITGIQYSLFVIRNSLFVVHHQLIQRQQTFPAQTIIIILTDKCRGILCKVYPMALAMHNIAHFAFKVFAAPGAGFFFMLAIAAHEIIFSVKNSDDQYLFMDHSLWFMGVNI